MNEARLSALEGGSVSSKSPLGFGDRVKGVAGRSEMLSDSWSWWSDLVSRDGRPRVRVQGGRVLRLPSGKLLLVPQRLQSVTKEIITSYWSHHKKLSLTGFLKWPLLHVAHGHLVSIQKPVQAQKFLWRVFNHQSKLLIQAGATWSPNSSETKLHRPKTCMPFWSPTNAD